MYATRILAGLVTVVAAAGLLGDVSPVGGTLSAKQVAVQEVKRSEKLVTLGDLTANQNHRLAAIRQAARQQILTQTKAKRSQVAEVYRMALPTKFTVQAGLTKQGVRLNLAANTFGLSEIVIPYQQLKGKILNHYLPKAQRTTKQNQSKVIALTFDDGPDSKLTPKLLKILKRNNVHATFFEVGQSVTKYPQISRAVLRAGNELGNHSWNHPDFATIGTKKTVSQINRTNAAIYQATGQLPEYVRPPYGAITKAEGVAIEQPIIRWSIDSKDWSYLNKAKDIKAVVGAARSGGIILMHDVHAQSVAAVPSIIRQLKAKGYRFVTVSQLLNNQTLPGLQYFERGDSRTAGK